MSRALKKRPPKKALFFITNNWGILTAGLLCTLFIIAGILISLNRFWQFEVFYYDFGIFDSAIWKVSRFQAPIIEHFVVGGKWIFADHFNPSIFLLSPFYWLTDKSEILFIAQAVAVGASGFVLFLIGQKILKNAFFSLTILLCYFLFAGLQNAVISDFHEITAATLSFMLTYYFFIVKRPLLYWLFLIITLGFKESNFLLGLGIGVSILLLDKKQWRTAVLTCFISLIWGLIAIKIIIPFFAGKNYSYQLLETHNPVAIASRFIDEEAKIKTLTSSFLSFGFLPIFSPAFWLLLVQDFGSRFIPPFLTISWTLGLHYSAMTAAIMAVSSVYGLKYLHEKIKQKKVILIICTLLIINSLLLYRFFLRGSFALAYNSAFYAHTKDFQFLDRLVDKVPEDAIVMTQNNLAPKFTHQTLMLLQSKCDECVVEPYQIRKPEYIVIDVRSGQNSNNFYGMKDYGYVKQLVSTLKSDKNYSLYYHSGDQYVFKKMREW